MHSGKQSECDAYHRPSDIRQSDRRMTRMGDIVSLFLFVADLKP
jgi:hypothetical protein